MITPTYAQNDARPNKIQMSSALSPVFVHLFASNRRNTATVANTAIATAVLKIWRIFKESSVMMGWHWKTMLKGGIEPEATYSEFLIHVS